MTRAIYQNNNVPKYHIYTVYHLTIKQCLVYIPSAVLYSLLHIDYMYFRPVCSRRDSMSLCHVKDIADPAMNDCFFRCLKKDDGLINLKLVAFKNVLHWA